ncbi:ribosome assembly cofactor RimP [Flavobacterium sp. xlx-214]|uniref:ribosome assembly cofactor RimP n=1 Tax=unclassified Flavobacterium TaxID=196869 RepID=UPI0013D038EE|nr:MULTISPECIES: ribosome assembly cofactor RimP [unclassified Flavobacterium]MBA5793309.1 ribosome assembly cofactor RimP [Flavobacterium sp. xlx-221]QMI84127.1 ribosome assembly cofactor RimP [Flavobacterium sp. xlx-214]
MDFKAQVKDLLEQGLAEHPELFLIDFTISPDFKISVVIDGDNGVTLQDCIDVSRSIEHNLDREEQDFSLEVASAGATAPMKFPRQYQKNIGRTLEVTSNDDTKIEAKLIDANNEAIKLEWKAREPKKVGKGKETVVKTAEIPYISIKKAVVVISF